MFYTKTKEMKNTFLMLIAFVLSALNVACTLDPISNIEDQYAAIGAPADNLSNSKSEGYDDDDDDYEDDDNYDDEGDEGYDDDQESGETNSQSISDAAMSAINAYVASNHPNTTIEEIEKEGTSIEVELSNGIELYFDLNGNYLGTDD
jgi:hypothetical protein